ncbi:MAG: CapA family protein [Candidatus Roizmanbacteria bacterium]|nr:CapA family protein [Candidatus Roizmanbacteria bacterium]
MKRLLPLVLTVFGIVVILSIAWYAVQQPVRKSVEMPLTYSEPTEIQPVFVPHPVSLDAVLFPDHGWVATLSAERITTVIATGDVLTARTVNAKTVEKSNFHWAFEKTADVLQSGDITIINLETPLVENCPTANTGMVFCGDTRNIDGLLFAGVDVVNLANNHMCNLGQKGVDTTVRVLEDAGLLPVGVINPVYRQVNGMQVAFLGYNDIGRQVGISHVVDDTFEEDIKKAAGQADIIIVSFHWGVEYTHQPTVRQIEIAHRAIDAGADLIVGNHPHWTQPPEVYRDKLIVYSHGNFVFDQMWSQKTREGIVGRYVFYDDQLIDAELLPVIIDDFGQARWAMGEESDQILRPLSGERDVIPVR